MDKTDRGDAGFGSTGLKPKKNDDKQVTKVESKEEEPKLDDVKKKISDLLSLAHSISDDLDNP